MRRCRGASVAAGSAAAAAGSGSEASIRKSSAGAVAEHHRAGVLDRLAKRGAEPIAEEPVRRADGERAVGELEPRAGAEPQREAFFSDPVGQRGAQSRHDVHIVRGHFLAVPGARHPPKSTPSWRLVLPPRNWGNMGNEALYCDSGRRLSST